MDVGGRDTIQPATGRKETKRFSKGAACPACLSPIGRQGAAGLWHCPAGGVLMLCYILLPCIRIMHV